MKVKQSVVRELVDSETGEITVLEDTNVFSTRVSNDAFYMTFINFMTPFFNLKDNAKKILAWMCKNAEFNTGQISLTTAKRKQMAEEINVSPNTITNNLKVLKDNNLISGEKGEFLINPQVFWKGELKEREKLLKDNDVQIIFKIG